MSLPLDTRLHVGASALLACIGFGVAAVAGAGYWWSLLAGAALAVAGGVAKELLDLAGIGNPEWRDLGADAVGVVLGLPVASAAWLAWGLVCR